MSRYQAVLDTGAVLAYARGSVDVGEVLAELADESAKAAVPALALLEAAWTVTTQEQMELLQVLAGHPAVEVVPLDQYGWRPVAALMEAFGKVGAAAAALVAAYRMALYVVTTVPDHYEREGLVTVAVEDPGGWTP